MNKGYSTYLRPLTIILDLVILNILLHFLIIDAELILKPNGTIDPSMNLRFILVSNLGWLVVSYILNLYKIYRFTRLIRVITTISNQVIVFFLLFSSLYAWSYLLLNKIGIFIFIATLGSTLLLLRIIIFFGLRNYRSYGGNYRKVIIVGYGENSKHLYRFFEKRKEFGYKFKGFFSDKYQNEKIVTGKIVDIEDYILKNEIDELYCNIEELTAENIKRLISFADNNLKVIKFIPDSKGIYGNNELKLQYYDYLPILALRENPFDDSVNKILKRLFDIVFSSFVILFILSWLVPILGFFIKRESKGPIFFKQKRNGLDNKEFGVYKFRSMGVNKSADKQQATKNDPRITKIGAFIRSSSIDELPQFINVLKGDMSVVGPRPHMLSHTSYYSKKIDKFMVRHLVKPGITGLAQIRGFRGETHTVSQMRGRVRIDRFYIENWSILLDIKIIFQTVLNAIKGDDNAY